MRHLIEIFLPADFSLEESSFLNEEMVYLPRVIPRFCSIEALVAVPVFAVQVVSHAAITTLRFPQYRTLEIFDQSMLFILSF